MPRPKPPPATATPPPKPKLPEPPVVDQGEPEKVVKRLKEELSRFKGVALAGKLQEKARGTKDDATLRFVLFREAQQTAARAGDATACLAIIDELAGEYDVDALALKRKALATAADWAAAAPELNKGVAEAALATVDEAVAADDYAAAQKLLTLAESAARKAQAPALTKLLVARGKEVTAASKEQTAALVADNLLNDKPDDPKANATSGEYLCFRQGDWDAGLPRLARCGDPVLRDLAKDDLARPKGAGAQVELGDRWWELAETHPDLGTTHVQRRACSWYEEAFPGVPEAVQDRIDRRIKQVRELAPNLRPPGAGAERARLAGHTGQVISVACSQDGRLVLSGAADGTVRLWEPAKGQDGEQILTSGGELRGVGLSPDGRHAAAAGAEGVWRWDLDGGKVPARLARTPAVSLQMTADGRQVVTAGAHGPLAAWSMEDGELLGRDSSPSWGAIRWAALVPGKDVIAFVAEDGASVRLWDVREKKEPDRPVRSKLTMTTAALTPDGLTIAVAGEKQAQLLDLKTGQVGMAFRGHMGKVTCLAVSPDARFLLTGSEDRTVRLWDVRTGCELRRFTGHTDAVACVAFAPDGRLALSGSEDQTVRLWELPGAPAGP
jgi:hypothetical protein